MFPDGWELDLFLLYDGGFWVRWGKRGGVVRGCGSRIPCGAREGRRPGYQEVTLKDQAAYRPLQMAARLWGSSTDTDFYPSSCKESGYV